MGVVIVQSERVDRKFQVYAKCIEYRTSVH